MKYQVRADQSARVDARLKELESSVQSIAHSLRELVSAKAEPSGGAPCAPSTMPGPASSTAPRTVGATAKPLPAKPETALPVVNSDIVGPARLAGVPEEQIQEMLRLATKGRTKLADLPVEKPKLRRHVNILSESEEEEELIPADGGAVATDPLMSAVSKLTEIAAHLTLEKKKGRTLEALLDGVGLGGSSESGLTTSSRKYSAALRALRNSLTKQPQELSRILERNMREDFMKTAQLPGTGAVPVSARAWLELRSKVQGYQTPVRLLWSIAGVLDCLINDQVPEARARCGLILAMGDQMAIDKGSWIVASEIALEDPPPMAAFNNHTLPSEAESSCTKLIDQRWMELFMAKLADVDNLNDRKKKLGARKIPGAPGLETDPAPKAAPKKKGKGDKGAGKAGGGADRSSPPETTN